MMMIMTREKMGVPEEADKVEVDEPSGAVVDREQPVGEDCHAELATAPPQASAGQAGSADPPFFFSSP